MAESALRKPSPLSFEGNVAENWRYFEEEFEIYSHAVLYDKNSKVKAYTLLNLAGPEAIKRAKNFDYKPEIKEGDEVVQAAESKEDVDCLLRKFRELCNPQSNVSMERHLFFTRNQKPGETIDTYINDLKQKARSCEFGTLNDDLVRDKFVSGVVSDQLRRVLVKESKLTLQRAIEIGQLDEITQSRLKQFKKEKDVNGLSVSRNPKKTNLPSCGKCGDKHAASGPCRAKGKQCNKCQRFNHFAYMCRSQDTSQKQSYHDVRPRQRSHATHKPPRRQKGRYQKQSKVYEFDYSDDESDDSLVIEDLEINDVDTKDEIHVQLNILNEPVNIKVDTGAKCNVLAKSLASRISKAQKRPIKVDKKKRVKVIAYGGDSFYTMGAAVLPCAVSNTTNQTDIEFQVIDKPVKSLLGLQDSLRLNLLTLSPEVFEINTSDHVSQVYVAEAHVAQAPEFNKYPDLFDDKLGKLPVKYKMTVDDSVTPVIRPARKVPLAIKDKVKTELDNMEKKGVISKIREPTDWCSNMVCAKKKDASEIRLCIDPRDLNTALKRPHHPLRTVDDVLAKIPNAKVFSVLDAKSSFWQIPLDKESRKLTCFATPFGRYIYNVLPYGVKVGSEVYQQTIEQLFDSEPCEIIIDDILVWGTNDDDHDKKLKVVLERCREVNLKLNPKKCRFRVSRVQYVGNILSSTGVYPDPDKVKAIEKMPQPDDVKAVQRLLGMCQYLSKFIENYSVLTALLRELLHKDVDFKWESHHTKAFKEIKKALANIAALEYYDVKKPVTITCDASKDGLGCALIQDDKPIHYASRALNKSEQLSAQIHKELLAVVFAVEKFRQYIYGKPVTIETDHSPLVTIIKKPIGQAPVSLQRLILKLQGFDINLVYKPGKQLHIADTLSRAYMPVAEAPVAEADEYEILAISTVADSFQDKIRAATAKDKTCRNIIANVNDGWPQSSKDLHRDTRPYYPLRDELVCDNGIIYKGNRIVVPKSLRPEILAQLHKSHCGIEATLRRAKDSVFWDTINSDITKTVQQCEACMSCKPRQQKETLQSYPVPELPWEIVATDIFELHGKTYLVTVDSYSGWYEIDEIKSLTAATVIQKLKNHFSRFGIPRIITSDSGTQYTSQEFKDFCRKWQVEHVMSSPHYHQSNSIAELGVKRAKKLLTKCHLDNSDIYIALLESRNIPRENNLGSPAERLQSRKLRSTLPTTKATLKPKIVEKVAENLQQVRDTKRAYYNKTAKDLPELKKGDIVRIRDGKGHSKIATVKEKAKFPRSYIVQHQEKTYRRNRRDLLQTKERKPKETYSDSYLEDYLSLSRPQSETSDNTFNKHLDKQTTFPRETTEKHPKSVENRQTEPPRRSQRSRKQNYGYQHIVIRR